MNLSPGNVSGFFTVWINDIICTLVNPVAEFLVSFVGNALGSDTGCTKAGFHIDGIWV